jgi:hypothetical protein
MIYLHLLVDAFHPLLYWLASPSRNASGCDNCFKSAYRLVPTTNDYIKELENVFQG